jgi:hypothetical protein
LRGVGALCGRWSLLWRGAVGGTSRECSAAGRPSTEEEPMMSVLTAQAELRGVVVDLLLIGLEI